GKKLAYHYLQRAQLPVCMFIGEPGPGKYLPVIISNDSRESVDVTYRVWENDSDQALAEGQLHVPANENWQVSALRTYASDQKLYLIEWTLNGKTFGNHYISGFPAFSLDRYREWLKKIARLPRAFAVEKIAK
ncbi:hypothetical protein KAH55_09115, partial [bacterium]|nr:hypothetical protein [bacterium]